MREYVKCKHCDKKIYMNQKAIVHKGYVGVFCSTDCCVLEYKPDIRLCKVTPDIVEDYETKVYEEDDYKPTAFAAFPC